MKISALILLFCLFSSGTLKAQTSGPEKYKKEIYDIFSFTVQYEKLYSDTVLNDLAAQRDSFLMDYTYYTDSVFSSVRNTASKSRIDSLNHLTGDLRIKFNKDFVKFVKLIDQAGKRFNTEILNARDEYSYCDECISDNDFSESIDDFRDVNDSISSDYEDALDSLSELISKNLEDKINLYIDSVTDYADIMSGNVESEADLTEKLSNSEENMSVFTLDILNQFHQHYRGRDEGLNQYSFYPSINFQHSSGFGIYSSFNFLSGSRSTPDDAELGISFTYDFNENFSTALYASHYWFSDSSTSARQLLNNSVGAEFYFDFDFLNIMVNPALDFSNSESEVSLFLSVAAPLLFTGDFLSGKMYLEPSFSTVLGDQADAGKNAGNILPAGKGKNKLLSRSFCVLDYELSLALSYKSKYVSIQPGVTYVIPVNVIDESSKKGFISFILEIEIPFKFKF